MELKTQVALVTGAGSGIGKAAALKLAQSGARIGLLGHTRSELEETADEITAGGGDALVLDADVADEAAMRAAVDHLVEAYGQLDIVVINAGIKVSGPRSTT